VNPGRPKRGRKRLEAEPYQQLHQAILRRDRWRCQSCGRLANLQVHHLEARSQLGNDVEENLMTLCADCHNKVHRRGHTTNEPPPNEGSLL
jgi:5-methylcytosine-specific restriction endonuclease McrA